MPDDPTLPAGLHVLFTTKHKPNAGVPFTTCSDGDRRRHDLGATLTRLRLRTQLLRRVAQT